MPTAEHARLGELRDDVHSWRRWGTYVAERSWGTVREDYSANGDAWGFLPHDLARSKAYRWGEDAIAGWCDRYQFLIFAPAFWNGHDPILKERLFGLVPAEANHGEDVKEYYFHLDNTPTHSYAKFLYKYPQRAFPYGQLIEENRKRLGVGTEYELLDTGIFDDNRYFDISIEYAKATAEDLCIRIEAINRGPETATLHILPHLWFRNTWCWEGRPTTQPVIRKHADAATVGLVADDALLEMPRTLPVDYRLGRRTLFGPSDGAALFTNNETNAPRVLGDGFKNGTPYVKDAFHRHLVKGERCVNPAEEGTRAALHYVYEIPAGQSAVLRLRFRDPAGASDPLAEVDAIVNQRKADADEFYATIHPPHMSEDDKHIQRAAFAGLLWTKQSYLYDVDVWLKGDCESWPPPGERKKARNAHWKHLNSMRIMTVPDKWEYPWFAAWDLAFHCLPLALVDPRYAKEQLSVMLFEQFQHPSGQLPAYEWEFSDLNPPVHAWAVWRVFHIERVHTGKEDRDFLEKCFHKLLLNFTWWINKVDRGGNNIFEGGFLGLDNITVVDRSTELPGGAVLEQADATGWMGMFCLNMMRMALELAKQNAVYEGLAIKFFQHYIYVAAAMKHMGGRDYQLWDKDDGFFYDVLRYPNGKYHKFRVRSLVGLIPLFAVERLEREWLEPFPQFRAALDWFLRNRPDLVGPVVHPVHKDGQKDGPVEAYALTIVDWDQLERLMDRVWNEAEFLSPYGIRSLSRAHHEHPFVHDGQVVRYEPAEADCKIKGGNSNWRGPVWLPTCFLLVDAFRKLGQAFGQTRSIEPPAAKGRPLVFRELARQLGQRLVDLFRRNKDGHRPVFGDVRQFQEDPHWRDHLLFYEYFHGDTGAGLGASHQTGWTALVATLLDEWRQ